LLCAPLTSAQVHAAMTAGPSPAAWHIVVVGHDPLYDRGMNAALALYDHYVYVGNRTDGSALCVGATGEPSGDSCPHPHPGILVVDVADPSNPKTVGEIAAPYAGKVGITTRELRVWPAKKLLVVMNFRCSTALHACKAGTDKQYPFDISFFNLRDPVHPRFLTSYVPTSRKGEAVKPHEMFLWVDPNNADRGLLYISTPSIAAGASTPNLIVADISHVSSGGAVRDVAEGTWNGLYPGTNVASYPVTTGPKKTCGPYDCNLFVHSMSVSSDGTRTYLAMEAGQFLILNTNAVASSVHATIVARPAMDTSPSAPRTLDGDLVTQPADRPVWGQTPDDPRAVPKNCPKACANGHSAVKVPGRALVFTTDEVYGTYTEPSAGCPWGWARLIDIADQAHPRIVSEFKTSQDERSFCGSPGDDKLTEQFTSYSSHNPTVLPDLAVVAWHSSGLQVIDISDAAHPVSAGVFSPEPLATVATEDPALGRGQNKVIMWSYPIIKDGLIYVVDIRNGLYILRYSGPHFDELSAIKFLEGNSNLGDAARLDAPPH
jgi:LVIVD repeat